jgi:hypothetical protein
MEERSEEVKKARNRVEMREKEWMLRKENKTRRGNVWKKLGISF